MHISGVLFNNIETEGHPHAEHLPIKPVRCYTNEDTMKYEKNREANALAEISRAIAKQQLTRDTSAIAAAESEDRSDLDRKDSSSNPESTDVSKSASISSITKNDDSMQELEEQEPEQKNGHAPSPVQMKSEEEKDEKSRADDISESTKEFINHFEKDIERIFQNAADSRVSEKAVLYGIDAMMWTLEAGDKDG